MGRKPAVCTMGGAIIRRFALFPLMLLMLLLLPAGMVAQKAASSSKYIATYESSTQTLTFKENVGETLPKNSAWVEDKMTVATIKNKLGNGTIVHIVFDKSFSSYTPTSLRGFFQNLTKLETITGLEYLNTAKVTDMGYMFSDCSKLTSLDVTHFNTAKVTDMGYMFSDCSKLTSLDVTHFNTAKVTDMGYMFSDCSKLTSLDVTHFNTANVTDMSYMFQNCLKLPSLDVTNFNTAKVTDMSYMFTSCKKLPSLDVTNFNTAKVTDMSSMFSSCSKLTSLDVTNFNTVNVKKMSRMFTGCSALTSLDVTNFNSENVTNMSYMFNKCSKLTSLDVSNFNTKKVTNMSFMFSYCSTLTTIYVNDKFVIDKVTNGSYMFDNCTNLKDYAPSKKDHNYANYKTGYFTKLVGKNGDEKIGATGDPLATDNLVLDDDKDFVAYEPFVAKAVSYNRTMKAGTTWGTLCLPFGIAQSKETGCKFYRLTGIDNDNECITLESCEGAEIPAGTPVLFKMNEGEQTLSISAQDASIVTEPKAGTNTDVNLVGSFTKIGGKDNQGLADTDYIIGKDKFWRVSDLNDGKGVGIKPMRAYIHPATASQARAAMLSIGKGDGTTVIDNLNAISNDANAEYYDANGRRTNGLQKGLNIVKRGSKTYKIMVK